MNKYVFPNQIQVLPDGTLVSAFVSVAVDPATHQNRYTAMVMRSTDRGRSWSAPRRIADMAPIGARDPDTGTPVLDAGFFVHGAVDARGVLCAAWQDAFWLATSGDGGATWSEQPVGVRLISTRRRGRRSTA